VRYEAHSYPVDVATRYHFFTNARWQPYLGVGARYVNGPETDLEQFDSRFSAQAVGGVDFNATDRFGLRFDAKRLLRGDSAFFDDTLKLSAGVTWRF
jgi:outer membrane protein W